jgi:O-antigen ligase
MPKKITHFLFIVTPLLVFFSAMAMTPLLLALALLALLPFSRNHLRGSFQALAADKTLLLLLACVLVWPLVSTLWSIAPQVTLLTWLRVTAMCFIGALAWKASVDAAPLAPRAVQWLALTLIIVCLLLLLEQLPAGGVMGLVAEHTGGDISSFLYKTVNRGLCALVLLIWPIFFGLERIGQRRLGVGLVVLLGVALMLMESLSAQLGYVAGLMTFLLVRAMPRFFPLFLLVAAPVLFFVMPFLTMWLLQQPITINHLAELRDISSGRILIWPALLEAASGHDWLGSGMKVSNLFVIPKATLAAIPLDATPLHPHHSMLQIWLELGVVGLGLVSIALGLLLRRLRANFAPSHPAQAAIYATVIAYLGAGFSSFSIWQNWWQAMPWILLLLWQYLLPRGLTSSPPPN